MNLIYDILIGIFLGVSLAAPPGPVTSVLVKRATSSFSAGMMVGFGAMTADLILLIITVSTNSFLNLDTFETYIYAIGSAIIFVASYHLIREYGKTVEYARSGSYMAGLSIGLVNPFQILWWLSSGLAFLLKFGIQVFYFLFAGTTIWVAILSFAINRISEAYGQKMIRAASLFSIAVLVFFGFLFLYLFISRLF